MLTIGGARVVYVLRAFDLWANARVECQVESTQAAAREAGRCSTSQQKRAPLWSICICQGGRGVEAWLTFPAAPRGLRIGHAVGVLLVKGVDALGVGGERRAPSSLCHFAFLEV